VEQGGRAKEPVGQHGGDLDAWDEAFATFHARFAPFFYRREVRERAPAICAACSGQSSARTAGK
jgi:hypothetical protein